MTSDKNLYCDFVGDIIKKSKKYIFQFKSEAFSISYDLVVIILVYVGIRYISSVLIFLLSDVFPPTAPNRYNAIISVKLFFTAIPVLFISPLFIRFLSKSYAFAKGKSGNCICIPFYKSVYLFSGLIIRSLLVFESIKLIFSYSKLADKISSFSNFDRDSVIVMSSLLFSLLFVVSFYKLVRFIFAVFWFIREPNTKCFFAVKAVKHNFKGHFFDFIFLNLKFLPIVFFCILSFGVLTVYLVPHYTVSLSLLSDEVLKEKEKI